MAISQAQLEQLYLAYFGRPADFDGTVFYTSNPDFDIWSVAAAFSASPESQALYGTGVAPNFISAATINAIYQNLFNRDAEPAGLAYWAGEVAAGRLTAAGAAYGILLGAQNADAVSVANKLAASAAFTAALDTSAEIIGYAGDDAAQAARDFLATVTSDPATLTAALAGVDAAVAAVTNGGVISGETVNLTTGLDDLAFSALNTADIVKGYFDGGAGDTLTVADTIVGNGHTVLEVAVDAGGGSLAAPYFAGSGIEGLHVIAAGSGWATFDATNIGTALSDISLSGTDGLEVCVTSMDATGDVTLSIAAAATGTIYATGALNGADFSACLWNSDTNDVGASMSVGSSGIDAALGQSDSAWLSLCASGGSLNIGDITAQIGKSATLCLSVENCVSKTGAGGAATVGDLVIGNVNLDLSATCAYFEADFTNCAYTAKGAATVGNVLVGAVDIHVAKDANMTSWTIINAASSDKGSATAGNFTVGTITVNADKGAGYNMYTCFSNQAYADTGNATVGNMSIGSITVVGGDALDQAAYFQAEQSATVSATGNATVGTLTVGDISMTLGDNATGTGTSATMCFCEYAGADKGVAAIGAMTFGNITFNVGENNDFCLDVCESAYVSTKGAATVGDVTIGNITGDVGQSGTGALEFIICASGAGTAHADSVGNFTVGNVDVYGSADANLSLCMCVYADQGTVGNVTVGTVDMYIENDASLSMLLCVSADSMGDLTIGDVTLTLGTSSSVDTFCVSVYADEDGIGNITYGDMTVTAAKCAWDSQASNCFYACADIGNVTIGDITATVGLSASFTEMFDFCFSADNGAIGDVTFGDITFTGAKSASVCQYIGVTAEDGMGNVTLGDVTLTAATGADLSMCFCAWVSDDIGNVTVGDLTASAGKSANASICASLDNSGEWGDISVGNIDASAIGKSAYAWVGLDYSSDDTDDAGNITVGSIDAHASKTGAAACVSLSFTSFENVGAVTIGDISMSASGKGGARQWMDIDVTADQDIGAVTVGDVTIAESGGKTGTQNWAGISLCFSAGDEMGAVTVGDVTMTLSNAVSATVDAQGYFTLTVSAASGGNTTVGDITVSAAEVASGTAGYVFESAFVSADFNIYSDGNLVIGDITVADGGYAGYASMADTSAAVLDNLGTLTTWLDLSVAAGKTITVGAVDYSGYQDVATIDVSAWKGAGVINAAQGDTTITDNKTKNVITLAGGDDLVILNAGATTDESAEANIDEIIAFSHGDDMIQIDNTTGGGSTFAFKTTGLSDYAAFLAWAQGAISTDDVAVGVVNGNMYVAIDNDAGGTVDFVIKLTGVTDVDATDFNIM
jgi:hypothetical protein